ncbi:MAG: fibronectin type III domain-containing protein [Chloroflexi bacterium]|nr:fibronectin type III domain-containing protein [Chloroflexota bacterium]OJV89279.1 MAG: hypothetical protein BGO39_35395 [Chloroflexi bacterium 54-19]
MRKVCYKLSLALLLLVVSLGGANLTAANPAPSLFRLSATLDGPPVVTSAYIFWLEKSGSLYGFSLATGQNFLVTNQPVPKSQLASDGHLLAWVEGPPGDNAAQGIMGYDPSKNQVFTIFPTGSGRQFGALALDGNQLYFEENTPGHAGLYSFDLTTRQETLISANGRNPVAGPGFVAWSEETYQGEYQPTLWTLFLQPAGQPSGNRQLAQATGSFQVAFSAENLIYSALPPATSQQVYLYDLKDGTSKAISGEAGRNPVTGDGKAAWVVPPDDTKMLWSVEVQDLTTSKTVTFATPGTARLELNGFAGNKLVFSVFDEQVGSTALYRASADETGLQFEAAAPAQPNAVSLTNPLTCGQVYKSGYYLYDCKGRWTVNGVQFILPDYGINGSTFNDGNYAASVSNDQVDYWLDKASNFLGAKTLRIFVDMPGDSLPGPTSPATIYDFALRASSQGMRLGVVLHNNTSWTLTAARKQWLSDFIGYFRDRNALSLLAYLNADNEINNHCGSGPDCYDNNPTYVDKANQWVADFTTYVKSQNSRLLVTVGISTEKTDGDRLAAVYDFFRKYNAPSLAATVDFISPHNYGGGGYGLLPTLRNTLQYAGPIVLEEYGYPTDPLPSSSYFKEGGAVCRTDAYNAVCKNTAPYFVEVNARSIRENTTNGYAGGSAWMVADSNSKNCTSPSDFYTGLFAAGGYAGCGGTLTTATGAAKNPAARIRFAYLGSTDFPLPGPTALAAQTPARGQVRLTWTDNSTTEQAFTVERKPAGPGGTWTEIATLGPNVTAYLDTNLPDGTSYSYRVRAYLNNGNNSYSAYTATVTATSLFLAPASLTAQANQAGYVNLTWIDNTNTESGFRLERKAGPGGSWGLLASLAANTTFYRDPTIAPDITYYYRVMTYNSTVTSAYSNEETALLTFAAPTNLIANAQSFIRVNLSWTDTSGGVAGFRLERSNGGGAWTEIARVGAKVTTFSDVGLQPNTAYSYRVRASYGSNNSAYTGPVSLTTPASATYTVTNTDGDATGPGTLNYAFGQATSGQSILLAPPNNLISVSGAVPTLRAGVTVAGGCGPNGPAITLQGAQGQIGLVLPGNITLYGLKISGFKSPQLANQQGQNLLRCVTTS